MRLCSTDFRWNRCRQSSRQHRRLKRDGYVASWSGLYLLQDEPWWILIFARWTCPNVVSASCHVAPIAGAATPTRNASSARGTCRGVINSWWIGGPMGTQEIGWNWFVWNFATSAQFRQDHLQGSFAQVLSEIRSQQSGACVAFTDLTLQPSVWTPDEGWMKWQRGSLFCVQNLFVRVAESLLLFHPRFWSLLICYIVQAAFLVVGFIFIGSMPSVLGNNMHVYCQVTNDCVLWSIFTWVCQCGHQDWIPNHCSSWLG